VETRKGTLTGEVAPLVVSASRATDIPAFYGQWFVNRLRAGHCLWRNPYNPGQVQRVRLDRCKVAVFWSKNPAPLIPFLPEIEEAFPSYVQYTLNDYEAEGLEPGIPPLEERVATFARLSGMLGKGRVVWRFDPLVLSGRLTPGVLLERVDRLGRELCHHTEKLVFSFVDDYHKSRRRLAALPDPPRAFTSGEMTAFARGLLELAAAWPRPVALASCCEAGDLCGIPQNRCVDPELASRIAGVPIPPEHRPTRSNCLCAASKDIGAYNTCPHGCLYCYANQGASLVASRHRRHDPGSEMLDPGRES
jgi:hypothetical protein